MKRFLGPTLGAMRCPGLLLAAVSDCSDVVAPATVRATSDLAPAVVPFSLTPHCLPSLMQLPAAQGVGFREIHSSS